MMSLSKHGTKRKFSEFSNDINSSPLSLKKQKQMKHMNAIKNVKQLFTISKLQFNKENSLIIADDPLFNKQLSTKQSQYIRWVIACKFIIASGLRFSSYNCHGMHRNKIPKNMYFYCDDEKNLCAVIHDVNKNKNNSISANIIAHCNKMETSVVQTYYGINTKNLQHLSQIMNENGSNDMDEYEDDDLWTDTCRKPSKYNYFTNNDVDYGDMIHIIRIPIMYYAINMDLSFYWLCCRISKYIVNIQKDFTNPLFQLFFKTIANFDCFMLSVPLVPLKGSLNQMFYQFAIPNGNNTLNSKEFVSFLATYDCWNEILKKQKCRKSMHQYWYTVTNTDVNIMKIVFQYSDLHTMSDKQIIEYINNFDKDSIKYSHYFNQLKSEIPSLEKSIVDF